MKKLKELIIGKEKFLFVLFLLILIIIALLIITSEFEIKSSESKVTLEKFAFEKSKQLSNWIQDKQNNTIKFASNDTLINFTNKLIETKSPKIQSQIHNKLLQVIKEYDFDYALITDKNAKILVSTFNYLSLDTTLYKAINKAINNNKLIITDVYKCSIKNKLQIDFVTPIFYKNKIIGALIFQTNLNSTIFSNLSKSNILGSSLECFIAKKINDSIIILSELRYKNIPPLKMKHSIKDTNIITVKAVNGFSGFIKGKDYNNKEVFAIVNKIPRTDWVLISKMNTEEVFKDLSFEFIILGGIIFLLVLIFIFLLIFIHNYRQRNLYKNLYLAQQEFETTLKSIGDAVITTDIDGKVKFLNPLAELLTGWNLQEAFNQPISNVFNIINENTRSLVENPVDKVLKEGTIVGLANHTLLISKDGKEIPIADSGAPIKEKNGKIIGVVLVFRDQTKERAIRKKIEESEANLNSLINNRTESIWSLDKNYNLIVCNEYFKNAYKAAYNFELRSGINLIEILSPELREFWKPKYDEALAGNKVSFEFTEVIYGIRHYYAVYLNPIYTNNEITGITALSTDITELKNLQFELAKSEERYRLISDLVSDYVFSTMIHEDGTTEHDWIAGNFEEITGYTLEEYKAAGGWRAHLNSDFIEQDQEDMKKILNNEKIVSEVKTIKKDGSEVWVRVFAQPYFDKEQKRVTKIYGAVQNINERKLAMLALQESEQKFSTAFNESPVALSIQDEQNIFIEVNQAFCDLTGYSKEEIIGKTGGELKLWVDPEESKRVNKIFKENFSLKNYEFLFRKKSGEIRNGIISASIIFINGKKADISTAIDITELKNTQLALEKSEKKLRSIFAALPDIFLILDKNGKYIEIAPSNESLLYKPANELIGKTLHEIFDKEMADMFLNLILKTLKDGKLNKLDYQLDINGTSIWFQATTVPYEEDKVIYIASDITDRKIKEQKILEQLEELRRWQNLMLDREDRVIELKQEVNELLKKLGKVKKYNI